MTRPRTPHLLGASALGLALVAVPALPAVAGDAGPTVTKDGSTNTIKVLETDDGSHDSFIPKGGQPTTNEPEGPPKPGDAFTFGAVLSQGGTNVGTDAGKCTVLSVDLDAATATNHCAATFTFPNGTLKAEGTITFADEVVTFKVPLVSGTGDFAGASGTLTVHDLADDQSDDDESTNGPDLSDLTMVFSLGGSQVSEVPSGGAATGGGLDNGSSDTALLLGIAALAGLAGLGVVAGGRTLASRRD